MGETEVALTLQGRISAGKYLDTERLSALLQRALENCSVWDREYKNEGPNGAFCAKGAGEDESGKQDWRSGINEHSKGA